MPPRLADQRGSDHRIGCFVTTLPGAVNLVVCCRGLETRMRLTKGDQLEFDFHKAVLPLNH